METQVLIIGGGVTGAGLARDLALRGIDCILAEQRDLNAGASGANHGLLHSGARYLASDPGAAAECRAENALLKRLAPHCIEDTGGLFVAVAGDPEDYIADFPSRCERSGIAAEALDPAAARELEPGLSDRVIAAYAVADATIDPFMLTFDNLAQARALGARVLRFTRVSGFELAGGAIRSVALNDETTGGRFQVRAQLVINAAGAWAGRIAALAGIHLNMLYSKGSLLVTQARLNQRVLNRLRPATDADILVPGGTVSILGTTSVRIPDPDDLRPEVDEIDRIIEEGAVMVPELKTIRYIRAYCGVRPLIGSTGGGDDRQVSRGFTLLDHGADGVNNFITITGGKLTTYRLMAEKTADLVSARLGVTAPCRTAVEPLPAAAADRWTEPGLTPNLWVRRNDPNDLLLCECEMVPMSVVESVADSLRSPDGPPFSLKALGLRSRIGKGPCQGTFCSERITAHLYQSERFSGRDGVSNLRAFLTERWRGQRPLLWGPAMIQYELQEAMHCALFGLELEDHEQSGSPADDPRAAGN